MPYFVYVLKSELTGSSYVGHTSDLEKRLIEHNNGKSKSTRRKRPWKLVYKEKHQTRSEAVSREKYFKSVNGRLELKEKGDSIIQLGERLNGIQEVGGSIPLSST